MVSLMSINISCGFNSFLIDEIDIVCIANIAQIGVIMVCTLCTFVFDFSSY